RLLESPKWRSEIVVRTGAARDAIRTDRCLTGLQARGLDSFSIVAAAGEWATELGVTGWTKRASIEAARVMFDAWLDGPPADYWEGEPAHDEDRIVKSIAAAAQKPDLGDKAVEATLRFLRQSQPVPFEALMREGRNPHSADTNCPVFSLMRDEGV